MVRFGIAVRIYPYGKVDLEVHWLTQWLRESIVGLEAKEKNSISDIPHVVTQDSGVRLCDFFHTSRRLSKPPKHTDIFMKSATI